MISVKNLKKTYLLGGEEVHALDDVSLLIKEHEFVAIIGQSGSGKSTFMNMLGCLDRPDSGEITLDGTDILKCKEKELSVIRNKKIGFIFQSYNLIPHLSIVANVELGMTLSGVSKAEKHKRALEVLEQVGLKDHLHKKPNQLSGGQMQRVAIARAIVNNPKLLLADEPTGALDTKSGAQVMELFQKLNDEGVSVLMITHDPEIAAHAKRVVMIRDGELQEKR